MLEKMKKSGSTEKNIGDITIETRLRAARNEVNYWKLRYELLTKYGKIRYNIVETLI